MPRANRYFLPGYIWHITHRCHKREFLLKFTRDKKRWLYWLFEAKKRFGLKILNYCITSNHIHLLVIDSGEGVIAQSMQLVAGRVAQEFNQRKNRSGAFWEDRYHASAIMRDDYLFQCLKYIDLNMNRAGVVNHPQDFPFNGYNEIINPPIRYSLIDRECLKNYCGFMNMDNFVSHYKTMIEKSCNNIELIKDSKWTNTIAVGNEEYINEVKEKLGTKVKSREMIKDGEGFSLREARPSYNCDFRAEKGDLSFDNRIYWDVL